MNCWFTRVATLYRCDGDGQNIRMLSSNNDHDNTPWMLPDGRILYMRWEYVDRSQVALSSPVDHESRRHRADGLFTATCTRHRHARRQADPRHEEGRGLVLPGHGIPEHAGYVTVVDPRRGPELSHRRDQISKTPEFRDPWAFSEDCFLVADAAGHSVDGRPGQIGADLPADRGRPRGWSATSRGRSPRGRGSP